MPSAFFLFGSDVDLAVLFLVFLDGVADEDQDLTVGASSLVIGNHVELVKHGLVNADG